MKFIHTSDWQVGMKALRCGTAASKIREERLAAGQRVVDAANANGAECILLALGFGKVDAKSAKTVLSFYRKRCNVIGSVPKNRHTKESG